MNKAVENNNKAVEAKNLVKHFGGIKAVDGVTFDVPEGSSFGFLGPNGAGKTTLMRMVCCLARSTGGTLKVFGLDPVEDQKKIKADIGIVPQLSSLDTDLTVIENLLLFARYHGIPKQEAVRRSDELLEFTELSDRRTAKVPELSGGMQRRLLIARALINDPKILVLDEPTTGLDPQVRHIIWQRMRELKRRGITLLVTTHYMEEAENLCDDIVVMNAGTIMERGAPLDLVKKYIGRFTLELDANDNGALELINKTFNDPACRIEQFGDKIHINADDSESLTRHLDEVTELSPILRPATLEDVFLKLTGRELTPGA